MMIDRLFSAVMLVLIILLGLSIAAKPDLTSIQYIVNKSGGHAVVEIPVHATEVSPGVFFLGSAVKDGKQLEGYAIVDYGKNFAKPSGCKDDGACQGWEDPSCADCSGSSTASKTTCYGFLSKGMKWKNTESYLVNPENGQNLGSSFVASTIAAGISKWESAAGNTEIIGYGGATSANLSADTTSPDGYNEVYFGDVGQKGAIAITIVWGIFRGAPDQRELVEWDMVFDEVDFDWGVNQSDRMDFENIATHELGHTMGLDDLYESACSQETMYGYASEGETNKRSLGAGDIAGIRALYG